MLFKVLKTAAQSLTGRGGAARSPTSDASSVASSAVSSTVSSVPASTASAEYPLEIEQKLNALHGRSPVDRHLDILFQDAKVGAEGFAELFRRCLTRTGTAITPFNTFQRYQTRLDLVHY